VKKSRIIFLIATFFITITKTALADQCPDFSEIYVKNQWTVPHDKSWAVFPLSPLAGDTGPQKITAQGLTHVLYIQDTKTVRCIYNKKGIGAKDNTYVIIKQLAGFSSKKKGLWQPAMSGVLGCFIHNKSNKVVAVSPSNCQWYVPLVRDA
jgi:hypothetical protein